MDRIAELSLSDESKVFREVLKNVAFARNNIAVFDAAINQEIPEIVNNTKIDHPSGRIVRFSNTHAVRYGNLTPSETRFQKDNYMVEIRSTVSVSGLGEKEISIAKIPLMLGSSKCVLNGLSVEELVDYGESPGDPFGYFIFKGTEKSFIINEQLRINVPVTYYDANYGNITRTTLLCNRGTMFFRIVADKENELKLILPHLKRSKESPLPLFLVYELMGVDSEDAISIILRFVPPEEQDEVIKILYTSSSTAKRILLEDPNGDGSQYLTEARKALELTTTISFDQMKEAVIEDVYPKLPSIDEKIIHLSLIVAQMARRLNGTRPADNRDSWTNKRLIMAGRQIQKQFLIEWERQKNEWSRLADISIASISSAQAITDNFSACMSSNKWGSTRSRKKQDIIEIVRRDTQVAILNQICRVKPDTAAEGKAKSLRLVQPSQLGYICPFETTEGDTVGLIKNLSVTCVISIERDPLPIYLLLSSDEISSFVSKEGWTEEFRYPITVNGIIKNYCSNGIEIQKFLIKKRRETLIPFDVCIYWNEIDQQLQIYCDAERPVAPLFVVEDGKLVIEELEKEDPNVWNTPFENLLKKGCIDFIDARERENVTVAQSRPLFRQSDQKRVFDYCEIDPVSMLSNMCSLCPKANHQPGPRTAYQAGMYRQSLGDYSINRERRFDTAAFKCLRSPARPIYEVENAEVVGLNREPCGLPLVVAFMARPNNAEDAIEANADTLMEKFHYYKYFTVETKVSIKQSCKDSNEVWKMPTIEEREAHRYHAIGDNKLPRIGAYIREGDCIIPKVRCIPVERNGSLFAGIGEEGYVDRISVIVSGGNAYIKVKMRKLRSYTLGGKAAARYSQKGVIGQITDSDDLPFIVGGPNHGITPDLFVNPHSIPSRLTIGQLIEIIASKYGAMTGQRINATSFKGLFDNHDPDTPVSEILRTDLKQITDGLKSYGMDENGLEIMAIPRKDGTYDLMQTPIQVGIVYYAALRHHAEDKIQSRSRGTRHPCTHQPVGGRANEGGLRIGEMERDAMISHGAAYLLMECLFEVSDKYRMPICMNCGVIPTNKTDRSYQCKICEKEDFGTLEIPYTMKYLAQILTGAGIDIRFKVKKV